MSWLQRLNPFRSAAALPAVSLASVPQFTAEPTAPLRRATPLHMLEVRSASSVAAVNPDPQWTFSFNAADQADTALKAAVWVYACAREIAVAAASIPLRVYKGQDLAPPDDKLARLLSNPAKGWTQTRWMEANSYHLSLTGRTLLRKYRARALGPSLQYKGLGLPHELFPFTAQSFKIDYDKDDIRNPIEEYTPRAGKDRTAILPHDMIDVLNVRPGKTYEGFSPSEAAQREISTDRQASAWQQVALQNRGVPDGLLVSKMPLNGDQLTEVEEQMKSRWVGMRNAHLPFVLGSDLTWLDLAKTAVEMELLEGRAFTKGAICAAFGVPAVMFDVSGTTYANYETARAILMSHTVLPQVRQVADSLNIFLCPEFGDDYSIEPDLEATDAMLPQLRSRWEIAGKALDRGVPMSQASETFKLGVQPYDGWDVGLVPGGLVPVDSLVSSAGGDL